MVIFAHSHWYSQSVFCKLPIYQSTQLRKKLWIMAIKFDRILNWEMSGVFPQVDLGSAKLK